MHIVQLTYFVHVVETGSINATAQKYFMTQQAINASLKKLESEIGSPLLNRTYKGIELTPQGHIFLQYAQNILSQYNESLQQLELYNAEEANLIGTLSIFTCSVFTEVLLPSVNSKFMRIHPNTTLKVLDIPNTEILSYFFAKYCKLCFVTTSKENLNDLMQLHTLMTKDDTANIAYLPLLDDEIVIVARPDNPIAKYKKLSRKDYETLFLKENLRFSLYQTYPLNQPEHVFSSALSLSNNPEIHKKFLMENIAVTYMPKTAYNIQFKQDGFCAVETSDSQKVIHCLLYWDDPMDEDYDLIKSYVSFLQRHFEHGYGVYKELAP
jgi:DNA-binding transcriptional LysR family regulator